MTADCQSIRLRVLLVDDDPRILRLLKLYLSKRHDVLLAGSLTEALRHLAMSTVDAIVCDMAMPAGSGIDVYNAVSRKHAGLEQRIVFFTGGGDEIHRRFLANLPNPVIIKPTEPEVIEKVLVQLVRANLPRTNPGLDEVEETRQPSL